jgi:hypothetical protein
MVVGRVSTLSGLPRLPGGCHPYHRRGVVADLAAADVAVVAGMAGVADMAAADIADDVLLCIEFVDLDENPACVR